jgi:hypothetical protein
VGRRYISRRIPGFTWVQFALVRRWRFKHWWACSDLVRFHAFGPFRIITFRPRPRPEESSHV